MIAEPFLHGSNKSKIYLLEDSEFEILEGLDIQGVCLSLKKIKHNGRQAMYIEYAKGKMVKSNKTF